MLKRQNLLLISFVVNMLAYQLVQDKLRMELVGMNQILDYFLGVAPNFFAAIALCSFFLYLAPYLQISTAYHLPFSLAVSFVGLVSWEFVQILSSRGYFDWHDILWTFFGCLIFYVAVKLTHT